MRGGTGEKIRVIRALDASTHEPFEFNRSINPRGGTLAKMKIRSNKKGNSIVSVYQDINSDGKVSRKELIFRGKSLNVFESDELADFNGNVRLRKRMHKCDWLSMKFPGEPLMCTEEYIPITYQFELVAHSGEVYGFDGVGRFKNNFPGGYVFSSLE